MSQSVSPCPDILFGAHDRFDSHVLGRGHHDTTSPSRRPLLGSLSLRWDGTRHRDWALETSEPGGHDFQGAPMGNPGGFPLQYDRSCSHWQIQVSQGEKSSGFAVYRLREIQSGRTLSTSRIIERRRAVALTVGLSRAFRFLLNSGVEAGILQRHSTSLTCFVFMVGEDASFLWVSCLVFGVWESIRSARSPTDHIRTLQLVPEGFVI
jgi:hypothetical protein